MNKSSSSTRFWLRHMMLAAAVAIVGIMVIVLQQNFASAPVPEGGQKKMSLDEGFSNFYDKYRSNPDGPYEEKSDFVMDMKMSEKPLDDRMKSMESKTRPTTGSWVGEHKFRSFEAGTTLREAITRYAQQEGMQVIWELDQDFIVKSHFQMDDTIVGSLRTLSKAIDTNFNGEVRSFFCPRNRSLVITTKVTHYIQTNCTESTS